ncbi:olfactory receptor 2T34-like protein [Dinothrombium tinctorium]|uniref:Olfactory receptor 2T34-like protein n=1 Tax=Dinothrombium tinctorium TaxID=1965070 RepID=A0A443QNA0_9ACAR|nr:olfactory receptor 2T34-like protein [Dinothrombium tinctorium]
MTSSFATHIVLATFAGTSGIIFNGYIICILLWENRIKTVNHLMLLHLACVDIAFCILILFGNTSLGFYAFDSDNVRLEENDLVFKVQGFLSTLLPLILIWTICGLCCDRYLAVSSPLHYLSLVTRKRATIFIFILWFCASIFCVIPFFGICEYSYSKARFTSSLRCQAFDKNMFNAFYIIVYTASSVILPIAFIVICSLHTLLIARHHRHRISSAIYEITLRAQATVTHQKSPQYLSKAKRQYAVFTLSQLVTVAFNVPFHLIFAIESLRLASITPSVVTFLTVLLTLTPSINGYIYGVKSKILKQTFKRLLQRYLYKKQASLEIDRRLSLRSQSSIKALSNFQSLLAVATFTSHELSCSTRRNSAPNIFSINCSRVNCEIEKPYKYDLRRQSLSTIKEDQIQSTFIPLFVVSENRSSEKSEQEHSVNINTITEFN